jgi:hypothetical protein
MRNTYILCDALLVGENGRIVIDGLCGFTERHGEAKRIKKCYGKKILIVEQLDRTEFPLIKDKHRKGRCEILPIGHVLNGGQIGELKDFYDEVP